MGRDLFNDVGRRIGPGLITGAADDDPSGIATYSQAGAQFGYALVWTLLLTTPLMIGVQMLSARIGWATREGLAGTMHPWRGLGQRFAAADYASMVVAVFGTTISPYLFFWQAAQEVEDDRRRPDAAALHDQPAYAAEHLARIKEDTWIGMLFSNGVALCIMLSTAVTLAGQGLTTIHTAAQAAEALRPVAGEFAFAAFALGIVGTGLLAVPVLAGSAAYAVSDLFGWPAGASHDLRPARGFHAIVVAATLLGTLLSLVEVDPVRALVWSAVVNGVIAVPIMAAMMLIGQSPRIMGRLTMSRRHRALGWAATAVMAAAVIAMLVTGVSVAG